MSQASISPAHPAPAVHARVVTSSTRAWYEPLLDRGVIPDTLLRAAIRSKLRSRLARESRGTIDDRSERTRHFVNSLRTSPVAIQTQAANDQHYELPPEFFSLVLGPRRKYSCCWWGDGARTLADAETRMLELSCQRAGVEDGMDVLDLGCGWGSLSLFIKERYPNCRVVGVSNSAPQRRFIEGERDRRGVRDLDILTLDANALTPEALGGRTFDRIVSIEMLEHMKNYERLLEALAMLLRPGGRMFTHIFAHRELAYHFEPHDDWIGRYFFTGGTMPSASLLHRFHRHLVLREHWDVCGTHYQKTANAWLENMDARASEVRRVLASTYPAHEAPAWFHRWRAFFMACAEFWGLDHGSQWIVVHDLFEKR